MAYIATPCLFLRAALAHPCTTHATPTFTAPAASLIPPFLFLPTLPQVRVVLHPSAYGPQSDVTSGGGPRPLCLFSKPISTTHAAKYSRQQLVGFTYRADSYDCVWQVGPGRLVVCRCTLHWRPLLLLTVPLYEAG